MPQSVHVNHVGDANRLNMNSPSPPGTGFEDARNTIGYGSENTRTQLVFVNVYLKAVPVFGKKLVLIT